MTLPSADQVDAAFAVLAPRVDDVEFMTESQIRQLVSEMLTAASEHGWPTHEPTAEHRLEPASWPMGCRKPSGCERRRACGYVGCRHQFRDIAAEIDAAIATLRPPITETGQPP